jgi:hypothetical protein
VILNQYRLFSGYNLSSSSSSSSSSYLCVLCVCVWLIMRKSYLHILIVLQGITILFTCFSFKAFGRVYDVCVCFVLFFFFFSGCCYEIYVKAVMREEARKQAKAEGGSA